MYKYSEIRVREIADDKTINSFEESTKIPVDWKLVEHMMTTDRTHLNLDKAKNAADAALFYYLTKDPTKQGRGEKKQRQKLDVFPGVLKLDPGSTTIQNGRILHSSQVTGGIQDDLDFSIEKEKVVLSAKDVNDRGGGQDDQFDEMVRLIERAAPQSDSNSWVLGLYLNGSFWDIKRKEYRNFQTKHTFPVSLRDLLKEIAKGKNVIIFSDSDLPSKATSFRAHFGV